MEYERYLYPPYDSPLVEAYGNRFKSVFVILHPFVSVPDPLSWKATKQYPTDDQILTHGAKCTWAHVAAKTGLHDCAKLNQALLTSIGAIGEELRDYPARNSLQCFLETESIWMPEEGRVPQISLLRPGKAEGRNPGSSSCRFAYNYQASADTDE